MELVLKDQLTSLSVSDAVFNVYFNEALVHQVLTSYTANSRQGSRSQKTRAEVAGSNKKPWRQKGTGRARAGTFKSPIWRSGGVTFAARPKNYIQKVNKKMYRGALRSIFSELVRKNRLIVVENIFIKEPKTHLLNAYMKNLVFKKVLIIVDQLDRNLSLAARNLNRVDVRSVNSINPVILIAFNTVVMTSSAIKKIEEMLT